MDAATPAVSAPPGRRERKKAQTRQTISATATRLFLERGFEAVTVKEIADAADVSPTTVFAHFPSKESLVFDEDPGQQASLVAAVREREPGRSVLDALEDHLASGRMEHSPEDPALQDFIGLVERTPALREYERRVLQRHTDALADAIAETTAPPVSALLARAVARFSLTALELAREQGGRQRRQALAEIFALLRQGWPDEEP